MSTHAVNQFEAHAQRAAAEPGWAIKAFTEIAGLGVAAMTRTVFYTVLDQPPFETSLPQLVASLPEPASEPPDTDPQTPSGTTTPTSDEADAAGLIDWLAAHPERWDPAVLPGTLDLLANVPGALHDVDDRVVRRGVSRLQQMQDRLIPILGAHSTGLAVLAACGLLTHPLTDPASGEHTEAGQYILGCLEHALTPDAEPDADTDD
ncbi:hypothetical protein ACIHCV_45395 [Streptomyces sp. NPDC051956]|uniref:hypothetical protein n=1 Tax=Streptomyces sp. NPDC051956 TaxID=3365677 RepID=UPI0037D96A51